MEKLKGKPTKPGFYWMSYKGMKPTIADVYYPFNDDGLAGLEVAYDFIIKSLSALKDEDYTWWGPLEPPEIE